MIAALSEALAGHGLILRGGFHPGARDGVPALVDGYVIGTLVLIGHAGPAMWLAFQASPEYGTGPDPLDRWSRRVIGAVAAAFGAQPLFPFTGPPWLPFVAWARRAGPVADSPLGLAVHPEYGLWHGYRGALAFAQALPLPAAPPRPASPCAGCAGQPCRSACPVSAFGPAGYDATACQDHLATAAGADCLELGCRARRACPVGRAWTYEREQATFHMRAFAAAGAALIGPDRRD